MKPFRCVWCKPYGVFLLVWSEIDAMMKTATTMIVTQQQQLVMDTILQVHVKCPGTQNEYQFRSEW